MIYNVIEKSNLLQNSKLDFYGQAWQYSPLIRSSDQVGQDKVTLRI